MFLIIKDSWSQIQICEEDVYVPVYAHACQKIIIPFLFFGSVNYFW